MFVHTEHRLWFQTIDSTVNSLVLFLGKGVFKELRPWRFTPRPIFSLWAKRNRDYFQLQEVPRQYVEGEGKDILITCWEHTSQKHRQILHYSKPLGIGHPPHPIMDCNIWEFIACVMYSYETEMWRIVLNHVTPLFIKVNTLFQVGRKTPSPLIFLNVNDFLSSILHFQPPQQQRQRR